MRAVLPSNAAVRRVGWLAALLAVALCSTWSGLARVAPAEPIPETVGFNSDIRPILFEKCYRCHGPDAGTRQANLRLDREEAATQDATRTVAADGPLQVIAPGVPDRSAVMHRITATDPAQRMPYGEQPLSEREVALLERWIEQGAQYEPHWSFVTPVRPALPKAADAAWARNPIDAFILDRLEREGLQPAPEADRATLIRRVTFDLTGLPPTPAEVDAFLADKSPDAYEKVVDRLLASSRYGERMAVHWLAAARYSDTYGLYFDQRKEMWPWRDWVIDAFNRNMPFDRFTVEQLAGDMLPDATLEQQIASGFNRNARMTSEGGSSEGEYFVETVVDRVGTTGTVWLGLTVACARCHDHKFDPISQKEFYQFYAYFNSVPESGLAQHVGNTPPIVHVPNAEQQAQLKAFDARIAAARERLADLGPAIETAQREWEASLDAASPVLGHLEHGMTGYFPLATAAERRFDGSRYVDGGSAGARGRRRLDAYLHDPDPNGFSNNTGGGNAFTVAAWIEPDAPSGPIVTRTLLDTARGKGFSLLLADGRLQVNLVGADGIGWMDMDAGHVETAEAVVLGGRHHVAATYDGSRHIEGVRVYVDGEPVELNVLHPNLGPFSPTRDPLRIGAGGGPERFRGSIWDVRLYEVALPPERVAALAEPASLAAIAGVPPARRTWQQAHKLDAYFLEHEAAFWVERPARQEARRLRDAGVPVTVDEVLAELRAARRAKEDFEDTLPTTMVMRELPEPRPAYLLLRGLWDRPGEMVERATPSWLPPPPKGAPDDRLGLAMWLVDPSHPLTARVQVNRYWEMAFGTGLVATADNFGVQGEPPSHPELLDWLATEFVRSGWDVKAMQKLIVTSAAYRQSSVTTPELLERDADNRLLARGPRFRLPAEMVRDQMLAVSGLLVEKIGGPSVKPYQPEGVWDGGFGAIYEQDHGESLYRRSLYTFWRRSTPPASPSIMDAADRDNPTVSSSRTNTPLQALNLMNDVAYLEGARMLAERMLTEGGPTDADRLTFAFRLATAQAPSEVELRETLKVLRAFRARYQADRKAALEFLSQGEHPRDATLDVADHAAHAAVASLILNLDEVITKG